MMKNNSDKTPEAMLQEAKVSIDDLGERGQKALAMYRKFEEKIAGADGKEMVLKIARDGLEKAREKLAEIIGECQKQPTPEKKIVIARIPGPVLVKDEPKKTREKEPVEKTAPTKEKGPSQKTGKTESAKEKSAEKPKPPKPADRKAKSKAALEKVQQKMLPDLEACREAIRKERQRQREENPPEPKPKKTRITKLKERLLAVARLIPEDLADEPEVINSTEDILIDALHKLCAVWKINRIHPAEKAISDKFDSLIQKAKDND